MLAWFGGFAAPISEQIRDSFYRHGKLDYLASARVHLHNSKKWQFGRPIYGKLTSLPKLLSLPLFTMAVITTTAIKAPNVIKSI